LLKKIIPLTVFVLLLMFAGFIALTQELDETLTEEEDQEIEDIIAEEEEEEDTKQGIGWIRPIRWFRSNAGGMALEEAHSRFVALRYEYALAIDSAHHDELPEDMLEFYIGELFPEVRMLYRNTKLIRTQWILRDEKGTTRVNAVFIEPKEEPPSIIEYTQEEPEIEYEAEEEQEIIAEHPQEEPEEIVVHPAEDREEDTEIAAEHHEEEVIEIAEETKTIIVIEESAPQVPQISGFIELFDENSFLTTEYRFYVSGNKLKIEYEVNKNLLIGARFFIWENDDYVLSFRDFYRYNRALSLRSVERVFYRDMTVPVLIAFPRHLMDAVKDDFLTGQRINVYPEFFGDIFLHIDSRIVFNSDERGRTLKQTLYNDRDEVIWVIDNIWQGDRIVSTEMTEGNTILLAEFEYDSKGDKIQERNFRNGNLERIVYTENKIDIEELYFNNILVLRAVWEDGRKISETRMR